MKNASVKKWSYNFKKIAPYRPQKEFNTMTTSQEGKYDVAVVGGGIVGLALAYTAAKANFKVALFERNPQASGASIRNFGMIWPIGQPHQTIERALRSREIWLQLAKEAGFWARSFGSLHLAYHEDELNVLEEFVNTADPALYQCSMLTPLEITEKSKVANPIGLEGGMWSSTEVNIDPREAIINLHQYLAAQFHVDIFYNTAISAIDAPVVCSGKRQWKAERIFVCSGADFETLFPEVFIHSGITKCKLQMMRTAPQDKNWELGPNLAAGLTLQHYASFAHCESLPILKERLQRELPQYNQWGIHVLLSQTRFGELTIGDSHEYGLTFDPFDKIEVNELILKYLYRFAVLPNKKIAETWNGVYPKLRGKTEFIKKVQENVFIVNALSGAGMTLSFGLAEEIFTGKYVIST